MWTSHLWSRSLPLGWVISFGVLGGRAPGERLLALCLHTHTMPCTRMLKRCWLLCWRQEAVLLKPSAGGQAPQWCTHTALCFCVLGRWAPRQKSAFCKSPAVVMMLWVQYVWTFAVYGSALNLIACLWGKVSYCLLLACLFTKSVYNKVRLTLDKWNLFEVTQCCISPCFSPQCALKTILCMTLGNRGSPLLVAVSWLWLDTFASSARPGGSCTAFQLCPGASPEKQGRHGFQEWRTRRRCWGLKIILRCLERGVMKASGVRVLFWWSGDTLQTLVPVAWAVTMNFCWYNCKERWMNEQLCLEILTHPSKK